MLKKLTLVITVILLTAVLSKAQWINTGIWPVDDAAWKFQVNNALAIDGEGKLWVGRYGNVTNYTPPGATKPLRAGVYLTYIFNPDGSQPSWSPIFQLMGDTMYSQTQRGLRTNINGDIILTCGIPAMFIINHKTGVGLKKVLLPSTNGPNAPCVSSNGTIFVGTVFEGQRPVEMYDQNLTFIGSAITKAPGFSRAFEVSKDGNTIYWAGYTTKKVYVYNRPTDFDPFTLKDSIMLGVQCESFAWRPKTNQLWMSAGSFQDKPDAGTKWTPGTWYAYDVVQKKVVDSLKWKFDVAGNANERPRGMAFTKDGNNVFISIFGEGGHPMVQKLYLQGAAVKDLNEIPTGYALEQNYPNPFNPTTQIQFSIPVTGFVSLKVYNALGQEVAVLINEVKNTGTYEVDFNAAKLSSGVYMYTLNAGDVRISKKMLLVK
jgi:hypothetical protein